MEWTKALFYLSVDECTIVKKNSIFRKKARNCKKKS
ncbi:hypothetical protein L21SP5_01835 [Salinivirga cyanobacteriivorans]|uniref:Uncharacterized protein n=1 Tax=Salinivirga cyanobacteriivorans TaxID=1307839 RepID=A0A0S2HZL2_9BACT|nr:hypothetical protein L21SP5_01835 [Salinivirga cyanobacteriivorans]